MVKKKKFLIISCLGLFILSTLIMSLQTKTQQDPKYRQNLQNPIKNPVDFNLNTNADNETLINSSIQCYFEVTISRFQTYNITFNYTDAINNKTIPDASANYTWYKKDDINTHGNGTLDNIGNGLYTLDFNTSA